jgi:hypothetical protein
MVWLMLSDLVMLILTGLVFHLSFGFGLILQDLVAQSIELTRGPPEVSSALSFIEGVHIGARALHVLNLIWFGCIARLSQWG